MGELERCPRCGELNSKLSDECLFCEAPLPWAGTGTLREIGEPPPIADPSGEGQYFYQDYSDQWEVWIAVVSFLIPPLGLWYVIHYAGSSPKRAWSAAMGFLPGAVMIGFLLAQKIGGYIPNL